MRGHVWRLRWRLTLRRRRLLMWNVVVPVVLLLPVALSPAAAPHRAAVLGVFVVFFGTFGGCIPLVRDRARGWSEKVRLTGYPSGAWIAERVAAEAAIDLVELMPAILLVFIAIGVGFVPLAASLPGIALALLAANLLGALVGALVVSIAEAALACGAAALFALHFSGMFRAASPHTWAWPVERAGLFRPLVESLQASLSGGRAMAHEPGGWVVPLAALAFTAALAILCAPLLARRSARHE